MGSEPGWAWARLESGANPSDGFGVRFCPLPAISFIMRLIMKLPGESYLIPRDITETKVFYPKGYDENRKLRIRLATNLHFANKEGARLDHLIAFTCRKCRRRSKLIKLTLIRVKKYWKSWNSYEEGTNEHVFNEIVCPHCDHVTSFRLNDALSSKGDAFGAYRDRYI